MNQATSLILWAGLALATPACSSSARPPSAPSEVSQDEVIRYRASLTDLRRSPYAAEATVDLEKVDAWLQTVQGKLAADPEAPRVRLFLDAIQAQLVKVKSFYARREAQQAVKAPAPAASALPKEETP